MECKMNKSKELILPNPKYKGLILNTIGALLFLLETDFLRVPITDAMSLIMLCFWFVLFCISILRISVSAEGIKLLLLCIPVRRISHKKISRIEPVMWHGVLHVIFETGKCPKFAENSSENSLWTYLFANMFRTLEYIPPQKQKDEVLANIASVLEIELAD